MQKILPFLWFDEQAEEAVNLYTSLFKNSKIQEIHHFGDDVPGPKGKVMMVNFQLAGKDFAALNGGPEFSFTPSVSFFVNCQTEAEIDMLWEKLGAGGFVLMPMEQYPFSQKFGWLNDRFGVSWQLNLTGAPQRITPFLMFVGAVAGKAEAAVHEYVSVFPNSSISQIERYEAGDQDTEGTIKHARFMLDGEEFMAMDSSLGHQFNFTPAISFFVNCKDQAEVDHYWEKLSEGGEKGQCGWLTDKFGVSWQIVPTILDEMMSDPDAERARRVTQAMLKMNKLDIGLLKQAYEQG